MSGEKEGDVADFKGKPDLRRPREIRLTRSAEYASVRAASKTVQGRFLRVSIHETGLEHESKVGVIASRRVGGAVVRNRLRRWCKELHRVSRPELARGLWIVFTAKKEAAGVAFPEFRTEWLRLARKLSILPGS